MKVDLLLITLILILSIIGSYFFYGLISSQYLENLNIFYKFLIGNLLFPFVFFIFFSLLKWNFLRKIIIYLFLVNILFLILPFFDIFKLPGQTTARWFHFSFLSFQPVEFLKLTTLLFLSFSAPLVTKHKAYLGIIIFIVSFLSAIIYKSPSLTNLLIFLLSILIALLSLKFSFRVIYVIFFILLLIILAILTQEYRLSRVIGILSGDEKAIGFQLSQARSAIVSGGLWGKGLGNSEYKIIGMPLAYTDSIFAIYAEETGFVGSTLLIFLFLLLTSLIFYKGYLNPNLEKRFFAYGVGSWISLQAFIHIMSNIIFTTGVPLPFFSYGPSSQIAIMSALGVINNLEKS